jgi:hypothetical protein
MTDTPTAMGARLASLSTLAQFAPWYPCDRLQGQSVWIPVVAPLTTAHRHDQAVHLQKITLAGALPALDAPRPPFAQHVIEGARPIEAAHHQRLLQLRHTCRGCGASLRSARSRRCCP